jgi:hypothetical protein
MIGMRQEMPTPQPDYQKHLRELLAFRAGLEEKIKGDTEKIARGLPADEQERLEQGIIRMKREILDINAVITEYHERIDGPKRALFRGEDKGGIQIQ